MRWTALLVATQYRVQGASMSKSKKKIFIISVGIEDETPEVESLRDGMGMPISEERVQDAGRRVAEALLHASQARVVYDSAWNGR